MEMVEVKRGDFAQVIEVATSQLTEHSKQSEFSPMMSKKKWSAFVAGITKEGILQPLVVTKGFRVIDGRHRLKAAREIGIEGIRVIVEDITEDEIPNYIAETKLSRDDLKPGQKAAIVIRLYYEEEKRKAKGRQRTNAGMLNEKLGRLTNIPNLETSLESGGLHEILAKKAGIGKSNMAYLLAVYKKRTDLFNLVFDGSYSINKAYTQMKADEAPEVAETDKLDSSLAREIVEDAVKKEASHPQIKEDEPDTSTSNKLINTRKTALSTAVSISYNSDILKQEDDEEVKESYIEQLKTLAKTCVIAIGENAKSEDDENIALLCLELLNKISGGN